MKELLQDIFTRPQTRYYRVANDFFAALTLLSITGIVLETVNALGHYHTIFLWIEYGTVFFFLLEYFGRVIAAEKPFKYILSFFGIIDLLAIVPTLLGFANLTFLKTVRIFRIIRFLRMIRLAKLMRVQHITTQKEESAHDQLFHTTLQIYFVTLGATILVSSSLIWFVEGYRDIFANIPQSMLWSAKVLLGGASQERPETVVGEMIVIVTRFMGLVLFGLLINIIGGSVKKMLFGSVKID